MGCFVENTRGRTVSVGSICVATDCDIDLSSQSVSLCLQSVCIDSAYSTDY